MNTNQENREEQNKQKFWATVLKVLNADWSQTCNDAPGTKIRIEDSGARIVIETGISSDTLKNLMETKYLVSCEESTGKVQIDNLVLGRDEQ